MVINLSSYWIKHESFCTLFFPVLGLHLAQTYVGLFMLPQFCEFVCLFVCLTYSMLCLGR